MSTNKVVAEKIKAAESYKTKGNKAFANESYNEAIKLYTLAIQNDPNKATYYTNRALARLKSSKVEQEYNLVAEDSKKALELNPDNSKANFYLGTALSKLDNPEVGLRYLQKAYDQALQLNNKSAQQIYEQILETKKELNKNEVNNRISRTNPLYEKLYRLLQDFYWDKLHQLRQSFNYKPFYEDDIDFQTQYKKLKEQYDSDMNDLRHVFTNSLKQEKKPIPEPDAPDYLQDPISFNIFHDPVITPSGITYERSWILEHLKKNNTDPFSREPLKESELYPNRAIKFASQAFINQSRQHKR